MHFSEDRQTFRVIMSKCWLQLNAGEKAAMIFSDLDIDGNGTVDEDEFIRGCLKDNDFVMLLNSGGIDPEDDEED